MHGKKNYEDVPTRTNLGGHCVQLNEVIIMSYN